MKIDFECTECKSRFGYDGHCPNNHSLMAAITVLSCEKCNKEFNFTQRDEAFNCCGGNKK